MKKLIYFLLLPLLCSCASHNLVFEGDVTNGEVNKIQLAIMNNAKITWLETLQGDALNSYSFKIKHEGDKKHYAIFINDELIPAHEIHTHEGLHNINIDVTAYKTRERKAIEAYNMERQFNLYKREYNTATNAVSASFKKLTKNKPESYTQQQRIIHEDKRKEVFNELISNITQLLKSDPGNAFAFPILSQYYSQLAYDDVEYVLENMNEETKADEFYKMFKQMLDNKQQLEFGKKAPNFTAETMDGAKIELRDYRGKVVVLDFWASWCKPCVEALPAMKSLYASYKDKGLEVIAISLDNKASEWEKASQEHAIPFVNVSTLQGGKCPIAQKYLVSAIPHVYLIDKDGNLVAEKLSKSELAAKIKELL